MNIHAAQGSYNNCNGGTSYYAVAEQEQPRSDWFEAAQWLGQGCVHVGVGVGATVGAVTLPFAAVAAVVLPTFLTSTFSLKNKSIFLTNP